MPPEGEGGVKPAALNDGCQPDPWAGHGEKSHPLGI